MKYGVSVPYCGYAYIEVEAESEDKAIKLALENEDLFDKMEEGEFLARIVHGNVFYGSLNEVEVNRLENNGEG